MSSPTLLQNRAMKEPYREPAEPSSRHTSSRIHTGDSPQGRTPTLTDSPEDAALWTFLCELWTQFLPEAAIAFLERQHADRYEIVKKMVIARFAPYMENDCNVLVLLPLIGHNPLIMLQSLKLDSFFIYLLSRLLDDPKASLGRLCTILNMLTILSSLPNHVKTLVDLRIHTAVVDSINKHPSCLPLQQLSLAILSNLALHPLTAPKLLSAHVHMVVLEILERIDDKANLLNGVEVVGKHSSADCGTSGDGRSCQSLVDTHACGLTALANLANSLEDGVRLELANKNIHHICLHYMEIRGEPSLRRLAALVLRNMSMTPAVCEILIDSDVHVSTLNAIRLHPSEVQMQEHLITTLANCIACQSPSAPIMNKNDISPILDRLAQHSDNVAIQTSGCVILTSLLIVSRADAQEEMFEMLDARSKEMTASFFGACSRSKDHLINFYLDTVGVDINRPHIVKGESRALSPIMYSVLIGSIPTTKLLLSKNAKIPSSADMAFLVKRSLQEPDLDLRFRQQICVSLLQCAQNANYSFLTDKSKSSKLLGMKRDPVEVRDMRVPIIKPPKVDVEAERTAIQEKIIKNLAKEGIISSPPSTHSHSSSILTDVHDGFKTLLWPIGHLLLGKKRYEMASSFEYVLLFFLFAIFISIIILLLLKLLYSF